MRFPSIESKLLAVATLVLAASVARADWPLPPTETGLLYIAGWSSDNIGEFHPDGTHLRTMTTPVLSAPRGVAVDESGNLVVVSEQNARVMVFDLYGTVLKTVTHSALTSGTGIGRSPNGNWYVGNFSPGRVVVFDKSWNFVSTLEASGMNGVNCVSFDARGNFAVSAAAVNRIYRFDKNHVALGTTAHASLGSPMSIAMDSVGRFYVSNGSSGVVTRFDANWNPIGTFGLGTLSAPQGIVVDENDRLTISNFSSSLVHHYDTSGNLLSSFQLTGGVRVARNMALQTNRTILARHGSVNGANGFPQITLTIRGKTADPMGRVSLTRTEALTIDMAAPGAGPTPCPFVLYVHFGEPGASDVETLPLGAGLFAFKSPLAGGRPIALVNSVGFAPLLGNGALPPVRAPGTVLSLPQGLGAPFTLTLQALMYDAGSRAAPTFPVSASNAIVLKVQ